MQRVFCILALFASSSLLSRPLPGPVGVPTYQGVSFLSSEALYWQVSYPDLSFVIVDERQGEPPNAPIGKQKRVLPHFKWGFRLAIGYGFKGSGNDIVARYLWYKATQTKTATASTLWPSFGYAGLDNPLSDAFSRARMRFRHQTGDLELGQLFRLGCSLDLRFHAGIHYAWIDHKFDVDYCAPFRSLASRRNGEFFGFGPRGGVFVKRSLLRCFHVEGRVAGALLAGGERSRFSVLQGESFEVDVRDPMKLRFVPAIESAMGCEWKSHYQSFTVAIRLVYELVTYFGGVSRLQFIGYDTGVNAHQTTNFGLQGPALGIQIGY